MKKAVFDIATLRAERASRLKIEEEEKKAKTLRTEERKKKRDSEYAKVKEKYKDILNKKYTKNNYNINRAYRDYTRILDSVPKYILSNLKNMPNNKGYIWKNIHLYEKKNQNMEILELFLKNYQKEL